MIGQTAVDMPSVGASYSNFTYYNLADGAITSHDHNTWDIAFGVGSFDVGVFVNEAVILSFGTPAPTVALYLTSSTDFASVDTTGMTQLYNDEVSWAGGAFNAPADVSNQLDQGWGMYDPQTMNVNGSKIYVIKLRNNSYKKVMVESLISGVYTLKYADLDGGNEETKNITKADFSGKSLAYFSFESGSTVDLEPAAWDLLFTRYATPLSTGPNTFVQYFVTGVLHNAGLEVVQADGVDPMTANHEDYVSDYNDTLNIIGHDWKSFQGSWSIISDRVYFVKTRDQKIWKIQFFDFEGSSTGISTLERTFVGDAITSTDEVSTRLALMEVFPNPAVDHVNLVFDTTTSTDEAELEIVNQLGQVVQFERIAVQQGLNAQHVAVDLPSGTYHLTLKIDDDTIVRPLVIR